MIITGKSRELFAIVRVQRGADDAIKVTCACPICRKEHTLVVDESGLAAALVDGLWPADCTQADLRMVARHSSREILLSLGMAIPLYQRDLHGPVWRQPGLALVRNP